MGEGLGSGGRRAWRNALNSGPDSSGLMGSFALDWGVVL